MDYLKNDLSTLHKKLLNKEITSKYLVEESFKNINKNDKDINAFISLNDNALKQANELDKTGIDKNSILSGIPVAIKDNIVTKNMRTTAASQILKNFTPIYNATVVDKLNKSGAINIGKTNMDEFAMGSTTETSFFGDTLNPWDLSKVPGGSSGGSAAAVASGEVPVALGSDTGGSIRQPASFNGIVGLKPTYGRVSRWGLIAFASSLDQIGPLTNNVKDNALVLNEITGYDKHDSNSSDRKVPNFTEKIGKSIKGLKIGVPKEYMGKGVSREVKEQVLKAVEFYRKSGAKVEEVSLPNSKYGVAAYYIIASSEASSNLERYDGIKYGSFAKDASNLDNLYVKTRSEGFGDETKRRIMLGTFALSAGSYDAYFKKAAKIRTLIINDFKKVFKDFDLILSPTTPTPAFDLKDKSKEPTTMYMNDVLNIPISMAGLPAISIPAGFVQGMPIGIQLIGKPFDESTIYQAAYEFEQKHNYHKKLSTVKSKGNK